MCILCTPHTHPSYAHEHIDQHETNVSVHLSTNTWRICQLTYRPTLDWYNDRDMSANVSSDVSTEISAKSRSTYRPTIGRYLGRYSSEHLANVLTIDCWRNIGRLLVVYWSKSWTVRCISCTHFILFWSTSKIFEGFISRSCAVNSVIIKQHTQVKLCLWCKLQSSIRM